MPKQVHSAVKRALCGRWPAEHRQRQESHGWHVLLHHKSVVNMQYLCVCFSSSPAYCTPAPSHFLQFARRLNVKIKVNGIRVNKTTGCLGNSVPCPTHSSLAFTFLPSLESNNTLLTEGHNRQRCSISNCI